MASCWAVRVARGSGHLARVEGGGGYVLIFLGAGMLLVQRLESV